LNYKYRTNREHNKVITKHETLLPINIVVSSLHCVKLDKTLPKKSLLQLYKLLKKIYTKILHTIQQTMKTE